ncbi:MAG: hypothetical protein JW850_08525 [Thermoflexales bacterium]|nr:hypothetical protein [Thermoflexales bacterium]
MKHYIHSIGKQSLVWLIVLLLLSVTLAGCGGGAQAPAMPANAALKVTGSVDKEVGWTEDQVKAMKTIEAQATNKKGETSTYTGVPIKALLDLARPKSGAATLVLVADDGYTAEAALAEVQACQDCIVSFREQGGFSAVLPNFASSLQVKGVVEIQVK